VATLILSPSYGISTSIYKQLQRDLQAFCALEMSQCGHFEFLHARREITQMGLSEEIFNIRSGLAQFQGTQSCTKAEQWGNSSLRRTGEISTGFEGRELHLYFIWNVFLLLITQLCSRKERF